MSTHKDGAIYQYCCVINEEMQTILLLASLPSKEVSFDLT